MTIVPFSMTILSNLSIATVITNILNIGVNMAFSIEKNLEAIPQKQDEDSGAPVKEKKGIRSLKSFNYYCWMKWHLIVFIIILALFIGFGVISSFFSEITNPFSVVIDSNYNFKVIKENNVIIADNIPNSNSLNVGKSIIMLIVALLSWFDIGLITTCYFIMIVISWQYIKLLKPKENL